MVVDVLVSRHGFSPENISFWRFSVGALVLLAVYGRQIDWAVLKSLWLTLVAAGAAMAGYVLCWFLGIERIGPSVPTLIALCLPPVLVTLIGLARGTEAPGLGLVTAALALLAFSWGSARLSPSTLTVATLMEPLTAVLLSALLLNQSLRASQWMGGALLLLSIWVLGRRQAAVTGKKAWQTSPSCDTSGP